MTRHVRHVRLHLRGLFWPALVAPSQERFKSLRQPRLARRSREGHATLKFATFRWFASFRRLRAGNRKLQTGLLSCCAIWSIRPTITGVVFDRQHLKK